MNPSTFRRRPLEAGLTLIELMVGLAIGLVVTLIVAQSMSVAEGQKRSATSGSDAQVNGALAQYAIRRDVMMAGYGLTTEKGSMGCNIRGSRAGAAVNWTLAPVTITDGAAGAPDTISLIYSEKDAAALPTSVVAAHPYSGTEFRLASSVGIEAGDVLIAVPQTIDAANWCSLFNASAIIDDAAGHHIQHAVGSSTPWNTDPAASVFPAAGYPVGSYVINVGQLVQHVYSVDTVRHTLQLAVGTTATGTAPGAPADLYPEVVNLQAMYGKDINGDGIVDQYDNITPANSAEWRQVRAIRVAVVSRSANYEKDTVTLVEPQWNMGVSDAVTIAGATPCGNSQCVPLKINGLPDWQHYRYKVYDAVIPLRNVLWSQ